VSVSCVPVLDFITVDQNGDDNNNDNDNYSQTRCNNSDCNYDCIVLHSACRNKHSIVLVTPPVAERKSDSVKQCSIIKTPINCKKNIVRSTHMMYHVTPVRRQARNRKFNQIWNLCASLPPIPTNGPIRVKSEKQE